MKIGLVTTWFERGAAYVSRQYREALGAEHDVLVYARGGEIQPRGNPRWDDDQVTWARSISTHGNTAFDLRHFRRWLRVEKPDVVLFNEQQWWPPVLLCQDLGIRTAAYIDYYTEATVPLFANYDLLLCHTHRHHSVFDWHPGCVYLPWGTHTDRFLPTSEGAVHPGRVTFFHNAGFNPLRKGTDLLLHAAERLGATARLVIHTQRPLEEALPREAERIERLRARSSLEIHVGDVAEPGLYHLGDVYVYPTRLEGLGLTVAEAQSCGLPLVVPDAPPMSELASPAATRKVLLERLQPRGDGYYWPQTLVDPDDLVRQMRWFCAHLDRLPDLKLDARRHAERHLDWSRNSAALASTLEGITPLNGALRTDAREDALRFERGRVDLRLFFPFGTRVLQRAADYLRPLASRYSGR